MQRHAPVRSCALPVLLLAGLLAEPAPAAEPLWQIGTADNDTADLALGPKDYAKFGEDPLFVVGTSEAKRDWPYVHPGPSDAWAGSRRHTFTVVFALEKAPASGTCRLEVDLADTHDRSPSRLRVTVGGQEVLVHQTPVGGPDDSVFGDPSKGREHRFTAEFPASHLVAGANDIAIETLAGSWVLYDCLALFAPEGVKAAPMPTATFVRSVASRPVLVERDGGLKQIAAIGVRRIGEPVEAVVTVDGADPVPLTLGTGDRELEVPIAAVEKPKTVAVEVAVDGRTVARREVELKPVRKWVVYLLPHSHVDIGYTKLQTEVERDHWRFYEQAIEASRRTADYPPEARFKWNTEVLWAVDSYLRKASEEKRQAFVEAVRKGWIGLDALYGNELTALCRPEELVRLVDFAERLEKRCGVQIDSAMISDVPGYTWGITSVLAAAGVKYFSIGPNGSARIGTTLEAWAEKPFWWITPDGRNKVLCWIPEKGYWRTFRGGPELFDRLGRLEEAGYPYDLVQARYCHGDNSGPGIELSDMVRDWNAKYAFPKLLIATTSEMMHEFEARYADVVPEVRGDFTPYWEDGAASSARETGINRLAAENLVQAEAVWAILDPDGYPAEDFYRAWRNVVLYDEHTWGAHTSISQPDSQFTLGQWRIKQAFAVEAFRQSRELAWRVGKRIGKEPRRRRAVLVFNTCSWPRTDLMVLPQAFAAAGSLVRGPDGRPAPSQRFHDGQLAFLARDIPPLGARRYTIEPGEPQSSGTAVAEGRVLRTGELTVEVDETTGTVTSLRRRGLDAELVDTSEHPGLNHYCYVPGKDPKDVQHAGPGRITVTEAGPLVATLVVQSNAPGCRGLERHVRVIDGVDRVEIRSLVDKEPIRSKEGVHFAFPFRVPGGVMRMDVPWAVVRPEEDQLPGACKNWFTVNRWIDVSGDEFGVTWATVHAPLVEVGAITAETPWIEHLPPSRTLYSYVMNNYWFTNYKADQEGVTPFYYAVRPHAGPYDPVAAARFGMEVCQDLLAMEVGDDAPAEIPSRLQVTPDEVIVTCFKPSLDGKAIIVRLFNVGEKTAEASLAWSEPGPRSVCVSNLAEEPGEAVTGPVEVSALGFVTLRAELP